MPNKPLYFFFLGVLWHVTFSKGCPHSFGFRSKGISITNFTATVLKKAYWSSQISEPPGNLPWYFLWEQQLTAGISAQVVKRVLDVVQSLTDFWSKCFMHSLWQGAGSLCPTVALETAKQNASVSLREIHCNIYKNYCTVVLHSTLM